MKNKITFFVLCCFVLCVFLLFMNKKKATEDKSVNLHTNTDLSTPKEGKIVYVTDETGEPYHVAGVVKYGDRFYAFLEHFEYDTEDLDSPQELAYIDMVQSKPIVICDVTHDHMLNDGNTIFCNIYRNSFHFDSRTGWQREDGRPGTSIRYDFADKHVREELTVPLNMTKAKPYLTYMDGKVYYGVSSDKTVTLYSYDMTSKKETQVFEYKRKIHTIQNMYSYL